VASGERFRPVTWPMAQSHSAYIPGTPTSGGIRRRMAAHDQMRESHEPAGQRASLLIEISAPGRIRTCAHGSGGRSCSRLLPGKTRVGVAVGERMGRDASPTQAAAEIQHGENGTVSAAPFRLITHASPACLLAAAPPNPHEMRDARPAAAVGTSGHLPCQAPQAGDSGPGVASRETMGATLAAVEGHPGAVVVYGWPVLYSRDNPENTA